MDSSPKSFGKAVLPLLASLALTSVSHAGTIVKANNTDSLDLGSSWTGGVAPTSADTAKWDGTVTSGFTSASLNADATWDTIQIKDAVGTVTIGGTNTLTLVGTGSNRGINANSGTTADLTLNCNLAVTSGAQTWVIVVGHTLTLGGTVTATNAALTVGGGGGDINVTGSLITTKAITKTATGTLRLSGSNSITTTLSLSGGVVALSSPNAIQASISTGPGDANGVAQIQLSGGFNFGISANLNSPHSNVQTTGAQLVNVSGNNTLNNANFAATAGQYGIRSDAGTLNLIGILGSVGLGSARNIEIGGAGDIIVSGAISDGNTVGNRILTVDKFGGGVLTLNGVSTYEGATTVGGGRLAVNGSIANSAVTVNSGATLSGGGTVGTITIQSGGTVAPGNNSPGILKSSAFTLAGTLSSELGKAPARSGVSPLAGTDYDQVDVTGIVTLTGADLKLTLGSGFQANDLYFLINNDDVDSVTDIFATLNGSLANLAQGSIFSLDAQKFQISYTADFSNSTFAGGNDVALLAVVPEPRTWGMVLAGLGALMILKKAQKKEGVC